jgi:hypothetical protein
MYPVANIRLQKVILRNTITHQQREYDLTQTPSNTGIWQLGIHTLRLEYVVRDLDVYSLYTLSNTLDAPGWIIEFLAPLYYTGNGVRTLIDVANSESLMYTKEWYLAELAKVS